MSTLQISETQIACRKHDPKDVLKGLGLTITPAGTELSNVHQTKLDAGCSGLLLVCVKAAAGTCVVKMKAGPSDVLSFSSGTTDIVVNDTEAIWGELAIDGDSLAFWGLEVASVVGLTWAKMVVLETSEIDLDAGENYHVASAAFNAKHVPNSGGWSTAFPV